MAVTSQVKRVRQEAQSSFKVTKLVRGKMVSPIKKKFKDRNCEILKVKYHNVKK